MSRRVVPLTLDTLDLLPDPCRACLTWQVPPGHGPAPSPSAALTDKADWLAGTLLGWGSTGRLVLVDGEPAGYALYAPPALLPGAARWPTAPVADDAVLLAAVRVLPAFAGQGLARVLVQAVAKDCLSRGTRALEAFGRQRGPGRGTARSGAPGNSAAGPADDEPGCLVPVDVLLALGFRTVRPHPTTPRLRMDLRTLLRWEELEAAVGRWLGAVRPSAAPGVAAPSLRRTAAPDPP